MKSPGRASRSSTWRSASPTGPPRLAATVSAATVHGTPSAGSASARRYDCPSVGSTAARSQAMADRTSRRSMSPTPPRTWCGMPARSSARVMGPLSSRTARMRMACSSYATPASASRTISSATARPCPSGSGATQNRGSGPAASGTARRRLGLRSGMGDTTAHAASRMDWVER